MKVKCVNCKNWERNGTTGICYGSTPAPKIMPTGTDYTFVWPTTDPNDRCRDGFEPIDIK